MASGKGVLASMAMLRAGGYPLPEMETEAVVEVWVEVLRPIDDARLKAAVTEYMRTTPRGWPTPAALLHLAPAPQRALTMRSRCVACEAREPTHGVPTEYGTPLGCDECSDEAIASAFLAVVGGEHGP